MTDLRTRIAGAIYGCSPAQDDAGQTVPFLDAPPHAVDTVLRQADAVIAVLCPREPDVGSLATLLEEHLYDRGNDVRTWPADEAAAYRKLGWAEGTAAARRVMFEKAARALLAPRVVAG